MQAIALTMRHHTLPPSEKQSETYLTIRQACKQTARSVDALYKAIQRGRVKGACMWPKRFLLIERDTLLAWAANAKRGRPRRHVTG